MKILIFTDNEGVCGVSLEEEVESPATRAQLMAETNALIQGVCDVAPDSEFLVIDGHGGGWYGLNLEIAKLHPAARLLNGKRIYEIPLSERFDALFAVGVHSMAGTPCGTLNHTIGSASIYSLSVNGVTVGESGTWAGLAGEHDIPLCFVAGDYWACQEIKGLLPQVETVAVKKGLNRFCADHLPAAKACQLIRAGAARAVSKIPTAVPYRLSKPVQLRVEYLYTSQADAATARGAERTGNRSVLITADSLAAALPRI